MASICSPNTCRTPSPETCRRQRALTDRCPMGTTVTATRRAPLPYSGRMLSAPGSSGSYAYTRVEYPSVAKSVASPSRRIRRRRQRRAADPEIPCTTDSGAPRRARRVPTASTRAVTRSRCRVHRPCTLARVVDSRPGAPATHRLRPRRCRSALHCRLPPRVCTCTPTPRFQADGGCRHLGAGRVVASTHARQPRPRARAVRPRSSSMSAPLAAAPRGEKKPGPYQRPIKSTRTPAAASPETPASAPILDPARAAAPYHRTRPRRACRSTAPDHCPRPWKA